jgi:quinolinate synthase
LKKIFCIGLAPVTSHPECDEAVLEASDYVGSTSQMVHYVNTTPADSFFMLTECGLTSRLQTENPSKKFVGTCTMCRYMKSNTLQDIIRVLSQPGPEDTVTIPQSVRDRALNCIDAMFFAVSQS